MRWEKVSDYPDLMKEVVKSGSAQKNPAFFGWPTNRGFFFFNLFLLLFVLKTFCYFYLSVFHLTLRDCSHLFINPFLSKVQGDICKDQYKKVIFANGLFL